MLHTIGVQALRQSFGSNIVNDDWHSSWVKTATLLVTVKR